MKRWLKIYTSGITLLLFVISLVPAAISTQAQADFLRTAMIQVKELQSSSADSAIKFDDAFSNTIAALNLAVGLTTTITAKTDKSDSSRTSISVTVRLPYLMSAQTACTNPELLKILPDSQCNTTYISLTKPPELPPPILV